MLCIDCEFDEKCDYQDSGNENECPKNYQAQGSRILREKKKNEDKRQDKKTN